MIRPAGSWTAIVPFKSRGNRKTRLSQRLALKERDHLAETLFRHVIDVLISSNQISGIMILSPVQICDSHCRWMVDQGRGLNAELEAARQTLPAHNLIVVHADLPFLTPGDVNALATRAAGGCAIAPDRHETGTNAIAITAATSFAFAFGAHSFHQHAANAWYKAAIVHRPGLALDIDTQDDLDHALSKGFSFDAMQARL
jgi:2-phospho-L-lactate guanylyltransferase